MHARSAEPATRLLYLALHTNYLNRAARPACLQEISNSAGFADGRALLGLARLRGLSGGSWSSDEEEPPAQPALPHFSGAYVCSPVCVHDFVLSAACGVRGFLAAALLRILLLSD